MSCWKSEFSWYIPVSYELTFLKSLLLTLSAQEFLICSKINSNSKSDLHLKRIPRLNKHFLSACHVPGNGLMKSPHLCALKGRKADSRERIDLLGCIFSYPALAVLSSEEARKRMLTEIWRTGSQATWTNHSSIHLKVLFLVLEGIKLTK